VNRKELQILAQTRLAESKALLGAGLPDGAYYLAGYSVECALKACIAKTTQRHDFPDKKSVDASHTHNLRDLVKPLTWKSLELIWPNETRPSVPIGNLCSDGRSTAGIEGITWKSPRICSKRLVAEDTE
jgi:hypothetical protein